MPDEKHDDTSLDRIRSDRDLARPSGFIARRTRELAQKARDLKLADDIEVVFPDKNFEAAIREQLGKPEGPITRGDLKGLRHLGAGGQIENLSGLEHAVNLIELFLGKCQISDLTPLSSLQRLEALYVEATQVTDISPLASMSTLSEVVLRNNQINDIRPLLHMPNLHIVDISNNPLDQDSINLHIPELRSRAMVLL